MPSPEAAVAIVRTREPDEAVLLMRRAERETDSWSGHWSLPGGRREVEDRDLLATALRELEEECGIRLRTTDLETALPPRMARRASGPYLRVAPFVLRAACRHATILDPREAVEAMWLPLGLLRDAPRHCLQAVPGRPGEMRYPAVALHRVPLWGFTYRLLTDWLELLPEEQPEAAGLAAANAIREFLLSRGITLLRDWQARAAPGDAAGARVVQEALFAGPLPAAAVLERFCRPGLWFRSVNMLEARPDAIRVVGAAFEEYVLRSRP